MYHLSKNDTVRYNELQHIQGKITYKTFSSTLKEIRTMVKFIVRNIHKFLQRVEYILTGKGKVSGILSK
ncbi:winged helix-turn-helix transcriptional regulator [Peribacillus frigoritolerans]|uniref:winged helix-turn-helix transcriptional regulator n=1 Tax=Peribacillus frigoritolerans TaxID=450367 RepID=UPI00333A0AA3